MQNFRVVGHDIPRLAKSRCGRPLNATALTHSIHYIFDLAAGPLCTNTDCSIATLSLTLALYRESSIKTVFTNIQQSLAVVQ